MTTSTISPKLAALGTQIHQLTAPTASPAPEVTAQVLSTTDYSLFKTIDANRPIVEPHVRHLMEQITEKDLLPLRPIDVNADFGVVDGQHRLEAARRLGKRIYYRVAALTDEDMATLNRATRNWKNTDYLNYWASKGNENYQKLMAFMERHPYMQMSAAQSLLAPGDVKLVTNFREGRFEVGDLGQAEEMAAFLTKIYQEAKYKYAYDVRFTVVVAHCWIKVKGFMPDTFLRKIMLQPTEVVRCATMKQYLALFERLYNYKTTEKLQVRFS